MTYAIQLGRKLEQFPLPAERSRWSLPRAVGLQSARACYRASRPVRVLLWTTPRRSDTVEIIAARERMATASRQQMIALQEELDWQCYRLYGLIDERL